MSMMVEIEVNRLPMSLNDLLGQHWSKLTPLKRIWCVLIEYEWIAKGRPVFLRPVKITYTLAFSDVRRRDYDNYLGGTKYINDALRKTFITRDDSDWLKGLEVKFEINKKSGTRIRIEETE